MDCDFIKSLTKEQKVELLKLLKEDTEPAEKYRVELECWENGNPNILTEYLDKKRHGKHIRWYPSGQKELEIDYHQGQQHGKYIWWHDNGRKWSEVDYHQGQPHGKCIWWDKNGNKTYEADWEHGVLVKEYKV